MLKKKSVIETLRVKIIGPDQTQNEDEALTF